MEWLGEDCTQHMLNRLYRSLLLLRPTSSRDRHLGFLLVEDGSAQVGAYNHHAGGFCQVVFAAHAEGGQAVCLVVVVRRMTCVCYQEYLAMFYVDLLGETYC